ncbi:hypothetical protein CTA1_1729 [Colletotrichum tanaceti]|uniref:Uncharacterized protein n=1 Tax=Colletotrichum tanaceti TaxID=1306861 RepID=A0A4U6WZ50_9PEZI|nr:hypothetical protein CTA1_1729 [Colletotrichum tanaceti]
MKLPLQYIPHFFSPGLPRERRRKRPRSLLLSHTLLRRKILPSPYPMQQTLPYRDGSWVLLSRMASSPPPPPSLSGADHTDTADATSRLCVLHLVESSEEFSFLCGAERERERERERTGRGSRPLSRYPDTQVIYVFFRSPAISW